AASSRVKGYARADFDRYFFALMLVNQPTIAWDSWYLDTWIREGELNFRLVRPLHPAHEAVAENIAYKARTASMILLVWLVVALAWPAVRLPFGAGRWALTAVAVLLAAALRFFISFATGLLAFSRPSGASTSPKSSSIAPTSWRACSARSCGSSRRCSRWRCSSATPPAWETGTIGKWWCCWGCSTRSPA